MDGAGEAARQRRGAQNGMAPRRDWPERGDVSMPIATVRIAIDELRQMEREGKRLWATPGEAEPYWAEQPRFSFDDEVAAPEDFLSANGYTAMAEVPADHMLEFMVEMPPPPIG